MKMLSGRIFGYFEEVLFRCARRGIKKQPLVPIGNQRLCESWVELFIL